MLWDMGQYHLNDHNILWVYKARLHEDNVHRGASEISAIVDDVGQNDEWLHGWLHWIEKLSYPK